MKRILNLCVLCLVCAAIVVYLGDYLILRLRAVENWSAYGSVMVRSYYAVQEKNNRTEYIFNGVADQTCVRALFPHLGNVPCWYLRRHPEKQITI